ncbi:MAG TPA: DASH family cryptochrome [Flavobacteriales bacterium]|jgi:deoxyribodipyrimidine photo-lyase|nr:DASH family cryptochrome [Flavobacteriales bacterium]
MIKSNRVPSQNTAFVWFRNDLRVQDQTSLFKAVNSHYRVAGVYCFDRRLTEPGRYGFPKLGSYRRKFLIESLESLKNNLQDLGIPLLLLNGSAQNVLPKAIERLNVNSVFFQEEWTQEESDEIEILKKAFPEIQWHSTYDQFLFHPEDINIPVPEVPEVFTAFRKKVEKKVDVRSSVLPEKKQTDPLHLIDLQDITIDISTIKTNEPPDSRSAFPFKGGEDEALSRLEEYFWKTDGLSRYKYTRNGLIGTEYSSKFSSWLALGCISPITIYHEVKRYEKERIKNQSTYWLVFELIWRDYFKYVSLKHGNKIFMKKGIRDEEKTWRQDEKVIQSWIDGKTADSFINANMIELKKTGWMSNRGRQNIASYFVHNLGQDWRIGAAYFEAMLVDYDVHSNYGNWMYVAGVGNDPRRRVFNTRSQAERYDTNGEFQNRWLQEVLL